MTGRATPDLVELMARTAYEQVTCHGRTLPPWGECTETWRASVRREMEAAVNAAIAAGKIEVRS